MCASSISSFASSLQGHLVAVCSECPVAEDPQCRLESPHCPVTAAGCWVARVCSCWACWQHADSLGAVVRTPTPLTPQPCWGCGLESCFLVCGETPWELSRWRCPGPWWCAGHVTSVESFPRQRICTALSLYVVLQHCIQWLCLNLIVLLLLDI